MLFIGELLDTKLIFFRFILDTIMSFEELKRLSKASRNQETGKRRRRESQPRSVCMCTCEEEKEEIGCVCVHLNVRPCQITPSNLAHITYI